MVSIQSHLAGTKQRVSHTPSHFASVFKKIARCGVSVLLVWIASVPSVSASSIDFDDALLNQWLNAQTNLVSWASEFIQIRKFPTLTKPLETVGRVSFKAPHSFRWQLGDSVRTVAVRHQDDLMIYYPRLKRAERYSLSAESKGPWKDAMNLLDAGFPRSRVELESRFEIIEMKTQDGIGLLTLRPKNQRARRMLAKVGLEFDARVLDLKATEVEFADGSTMRTEYRNPSANPDLPDTLFHLDLPSDVRVSESTAQ